MNRREFTKYLSETQYESLYGSLAAHDRRFHPNGYQEGDSCEVREKLGKTDKPDEDVNQDNGYPNERTTRLAPNGKRSNLTNRQYDQVRTPEFKKWFGDWENNPEHASKVVDENGEPMVVYHGTGGRFCIFDKMMIGERSSWNGSGFYFSDSESDAKMYGPSVMKVFLDIKRPFNSDKYESLPLPMDRFGLGGRTFSDVENEVAEFADRVELSKTDEGNGFVNIFWTSDGGKNWEHAARGGCRFIGSDEKIKDNIARRMFSNQYGVEYYSKPLFRDFRPTTITSILQSIGHDGIIAESSNIPGANEFVAFSPSQIKSATDNNGSFSVESDDIRDEAKGKVREYLQIVQDSVSDGPKNETLEEHREHCEAEEGNCPFEKKADKTDDLTKKENVGKTPEQLDAEYVDAVKRGDMKACAKMVREAAAKAMPNTKVVDDDGLPKVVYHGTIASKKDGSPFTVFKPGDANGGGGNEIYFSADESVARFFAGNGNIMFHDPVSIAESLKIGDSEGTLAFIKNLTGATRVYINKLAPNNWRLDEEYDDGTSSSGPLFTMDDIRNNRTLTESMYLKNLHDIAVDYAKQYASERSGTKGAKFDHGSGYTKEVAYRGGVYRCYINIIKPLVVDAKGGSFDNFNYNGEWIDIATMSARAKTEGYDGLIVKNVRETTRGNGILTTDYIPFDAKQIKTSDVIVDDDAGNIIPLSERFNMKNPDIRY